ncbi:hypothetical protein BVRB_8g195670 [Beta vulgaris subsp. vulgaris]|nr:hypothetical protein BVRB_8g195670 [Beta vulgaris subsp. vulgaris]
MSKISITIDSKNSKRDATEAFLEDEGLKSYEYYAPKTQFEADDDNDDDDDGTYDFAPAA